MLSVYIDYLLKPLLVLSIVLALHWLVLWQVVQDAPEKPVVQSPKPIMVSLITLAPVPPPIAKKRAKLPKKIAKAWKRKKVKTVKNKIAIAQPKATIKPAIRVRTPTYVRQNTKSTYRQYSQPYEHRTKPAIRVRTPTYVRQNTKSTYRQYSQPSEHRTKPIRSANTNRTYSQYSQPSEHRTKPERSANTNRTYSQYSQPSEHEQNGRKKGNSVTTAPSYKASYLHNPSPNYPRMSKRRGEEGKVLLRVKVTKNGKAASVQIQQSSGFNRLDNAARKAVSEWRFIPAKKDGKPDSGWVIVPIVFKLS